MEILVKYHEEGLTLEKLPQGDWIDLKSAEDVDMEQGDFRIISLGISMKLPEDYEAHVAPRSSTYKKWGILQANGIGIIDNSYCGNDDVWRFPAIAMRDTRIRKGDRICQMRIVKKQPDFDLVEVDKLLDDSRGGFGSTGWS